jgi:pimeloyl-ACP methyl ester carboxylesterase
VSTPTSLALPAGVRRTKIPTSRGSFAALEALPVPGVCERETALLVPGYTGSKEDFIAILDQLAAGGRRVIAIDMRGQYQSAGSPGGYSPQALGADIAAIARATGTRHLLGHSYGGLVAREAMLGDLAGDGIESFTLMSSGPAALTGPRADELRMTLAVLGVPDGISNPGAGGTFPPDPADAEAEGTFPPDPPDGSTARPLDHQAPSVEQIAGVWKAYLEPKAIAAGTPPEIVAFLRDRMLGNDPAALVAMAWNILTAADRTDELARLEGVPMLVIYGENDDSWSPSAQDLMARRLGARRVCIPGAVHSPNVEAPATTASALTDFWDTAEKHDHGSLRPIGDRFDP